MDAIPFSVEQVPDVVESWDIYTPSAVRKANQHASLVRRLGGFSFQELMAPSAEVKKFMESGADLTYDFFTRPPYLHAILTGDAALLRLAFRRLQEADVPSRLLVHDLQNHDELTYQLPELAALGSTRLRYGDRPMSALRLRRLVLREMQAKAAGEQAPWNLLYRRHIEGGDGIATTMVGFIAAGLGINPYKATAVQREQIKQAHLLVALANALQPGVFSLSMWDLVGALPLPKEEVQDRMHDNDFRWVNRGGVDLLGESSDKATSVIGLPRAESIYGPLPKQLEDEHSFASQLKQMLAARDTYKIALGELMKPPLADPENSGVCLLPMRLPGPGKGLLAVTVLNFGREPAEEELNWVEWFQDIQVKVDSIRGRQITNAISGDRVGAVDVNGRMTLEIDAIQGMTLLIQ